MGPASSVGVSLGVGMKETKRFAFPGAVTLVSAAVLATFSGGRRRSGGRCPYPELEKKLERSMQMIETLQTKVQTLEAGQAAGPAAAPANAEQAAKIDALEKQVAQLGSGISNRSTLDSGVPCTVSWKSALAAAAKKTIRPTAAATRASRSAASTCT